MEMVFNLGDGTLSPARSGLVVTINATSPHKKILPVEATVLFLLFLFGDSPGDEAHNGARL